MGQDRRVGGHPRMTKKVYRDPPRKSLVATKNKEYSGRVVSGLSQNRLLTSLKISYRKGRLERKGGVAWGVEEGGLHFGSRLLARARSWAPENKKLLSPLKLVLGSRTILRKPGRDSRIRFATNCVLEQDKQNGTRVLVKSGDRPAYDKKFVADIDDRASQ